MVEDLFEGRGFRACPGRSRRVLHSPLILVIPRRLPAGNLLSDYVFANSESVLRPFPLQPGEKLPHPFQSPVQLFLRYRIRHANVVLRAEGLAGNYHNVGFVQQLIRGV